MEDSVVLGRKPQMNVLEDINRVKNKRQFPLIFSLLVLVLIIMVFGLSTSGDFFKASVLRGIFDQALIIGIMATAVAFIYSTGNLDISVGSVMGLGAACGAIAYSMTENVVIMLAVAIIVGTLLMVLNSVLSIVFNIQSITVAIVMMQLYNSVISKVVGPNSLKVNYQMSKMLENNGYRYAAFIAYFVICILIYHFTPLGRTLRFLGGNQACGEQTGMDSKKAIFLSFIIAGVGIGIAASFTIIRTASVSSEVGNGMGIDVMLATVLGGMSIFGGAKSNSYSGFIGALTVSALNKGLLMVGVSAALIQGVRGIVFLILIFLNSERSSTLPTRQQV